MHIRHEVFTGAFARSVGVVGNPCPYSGVAGRFSNCPQMHRRDLEIRGVAKTDEVKRVEPGFHFSDENDGYYGFFY